MGSDEGRRFWVGDHAVACGFCEHDLFHDREIQLNTAGLTFMGLDWANRSSVGLICTQCGYIMEFVGGNISVADADADTPS